eukprot:6701686-Pyramimonas_sp.AAC.1
MQPRSHRQGRASPWEHDRATVQGRGAGADIHGAAAQRHARARRLRVRGQAGGLRGDQGYRTLPRKGTRLSPVQAQEPHGGTQWQKDPKDHAPGGKRPIHPSFGPCVLRGARIHRPITVPQ